MSASVSRLAHKLLQSSVCTNLIGLLVCCSLDTANLSSFNVFILPILQLGMSAITEKIQRILRSRIKTETDPLSNIEQEMNENRIKLREILSDQHRVMYYTVTISTLPPSTIQQQRVRKDSTNLKWQCASTLHKTRLLLGNRQS